MSIGLGIGVQRPKQLRSIYSVNGKVPGFAADFIKNKYPSYSSFASAITHSRSGNAVMTDGYGPELVTNGGFDSDSDWTKGTGWTISDGVASSDGSQSSASALQAVDILTIGKTYVVTFTVVSRSAGSITARAGTNGVGTARTATGTYTEIITCAGTDDLRMTASNDFVGSIDSVSVREMPVLKWAPHNKLQYSEDLGSWTNFNTTDSLNQIAAPDGTTTADKVVEDSSSAVHNIYQTGITVVSGVDYTFCTFVKQGEYKWVQLSFALSNSTFTANDFANFDVNAGTVGTTGSGATATIEDVGSGWYKCSVTATAAASASSGATICLTDNTDASSRNPSYAGDGSSGIYVWGMHFNRGDLGGMVDNPDQPLSRASYVPTTSSAVYLPRIGHHVYNGSAWVNEGLLAESEARTNLVTYSNPDNSWTKGATTLTLDDAVSPDGTENATKITEGSSSSAHYTHSASASFTSGVTYTLSAYLKAGTKSIVQLAGTSSGFGSTLYGNFDLANGVVGSAGSGVVSTIEDVGNGWYRCSITGDATVTASGAAVIIALIDDLTDTRLAAYTGSTSNNLYAYGTQTEQASTPSSLLPTSGSSVTRAAETFTIPSANLPWPSPDYIGSEIIANGDFSSSSDWTLHSSWAIANGVATHTAGSGGQISQAYSFTSGKVYSIKYEITGQTAGTLSARLSSASGLVADAIIGESKTADGSYEDILVADSTSAYVGLFANGTFDGSVDNVSVREINPLSVSIAMDGRMTYADKDTYATASFFRWDIDSNNFIRTRIDTASYAGTGNIITLQKEGGTEDIVSTAASYLSPDVLVPYSFASRHGSTFINLGTDGVALTANTTPTALADLSSTDMRIAFIYMGTIGTFRVWDRDIGDTGLVEATNPSLEPSLSLDFLGAGTTSFVVNDWSE